MLGNKEVYAYHVPLQKKQAQFYERLTQTLKNALYMYFPVELKPLFLLSFQGSQMQFQSQRLVMLQTHTYVTADLYDKQPDKPRIV